MLNAFSPSAPAVYTLAPDRYAKAVAYSRAQYRLHFLSVAWEILVLVLLIGLAVAPSFRRLAERVSRRRFVQALVFFPLLLVVLGVLQLPVDVLGHRLSLAYDQSVQGWFSWLWDWTKGEPPKESPAYYLRFCKSFSRMHGRAGRRASIPSSTRWKCRAASSRIFRPMRLRSRHWSVRARVPPAHCRESSRPISCSRWAPSSSSSSSR